MDALAETANFADWYEALRSQGASAPTAVLPSSVQAKLENVVRNYEKQSSVLEANRRRVNVLIVGDVEEERNAAVDYIARNLGLRSVTIDGAAISGAHEDDANAALRPIVEHVALVAVVNGIDVDADSRLRDALAWSSRDVLVIGCVDSKDKIDANMRRTFDAVVDLSPKRNFALPFSFGSSRAHAH